MSIFLVTPPTQEPLTVVEAKLHMRVSIEDDDRLIFDLIAAARDYLEKATWRQFLTATWRLSLHRFPHAPIRLPHATPLQSIAVTLLDSEGAPQPTGLGITYIDSDGVAQTLAETVYWVDADSQPALLYLMPSQAWPGISQVPNGVRVTYKAGYRTPHELFARHASLRSAMLLLVAHLYEQREATVEKALSETCLGLESLLWMNRLMEVL